MSKQYAKLAVANELVPSGMQVIYEPINYSLVDGVTGALAQKVFEYVLTRAGSNSDSGFLKFVSDPLGTLCGWGTDIWDAIKNWWYGGQTGTESGTLGQKLLEYSDDYLSDADVDKIIAAFNSITSVSSSVPTDHVVRLNALGIYVNPKITEDVRARIGSYIIKFEGKDDAQFGDLLADVIIAAQRLDAYISAGSVPLEVSDAISKLGALMVA